MIELHAGDNRESLRRLIDQGVRVHSCVTDPPYGLVSVQKRFGKEGSKPARSDKNDGSFTRLGGGFMGRKWDATEIERDPEFWRLIHDILLPGGYCFAFSGARTGHWQGCAMEMAGFIIHPVHVWAYGSGLPKGHNPKVEGFEDWKHGTQAQKPAVEPIYLGQRPFSEKTCAANIRKHGVGAVNVGDCRVPYDMADTSPATNPLHRKLAGYKNGNSSDAGSSNYSLKDGSGERNPNELGRYPSNLILDGSAEVVALFPDSKGQIAKASISDTKRAGQNCYGEMVRGSNGQEPRGDSGSAARFFHHFPPDTNPLIYNGKANKADRAGSSHPTVKPIALLQYLIRHITPPGGTVLDCFAGSGTTAEAAKREGFDCILMEAEPEYVDFLRRRFDLPGVMAHEDDGFPEDDPVNDDFPDHLLDAAQ